MQFASAQAGDVVAKTWISTFRHKPAHHETDLTAADLLQGGNALSQHPDNVKKHNKHDIWPYAVTCTDTKE